MRRNNSTLTVLSLATNRVWKDRETGERQSQTTWHRCVSFGSTATYAAALTKGAYVQILGEIQTREYVAKDGAKKAVTEVRDRAKAASVELPKEKFYLGFSRYETAPPDKNASSLLGRDLKAIQWVVDQLVATPILALKDIKRTEIPEEKGGAPVTPRPGPAGGNQPAGAGRVPANLLNVHTFEITFNSKQHQLAKVLNTIVSAGAPQFYIIRQVRILNSNQKAPPRATPIADAAPAAPVVTGTPAPLPGAPAAPAAPAPAVAAAVPGFQAPTTIASLVGEETIDTTLRLEIVDFAEPSTPAPAAPK